MRRARARTSATREVSIVIQRRPHCSTHKPLSRPAGGIKHEITGIGSHEDASFHNRWGRLHHVELLCTKSTRLRVFPNVSRLLGTSDHRRSKARSFPIVSRRPALATRYIPSLLVDQCRFSFLGNLRCWNSMSLSLFDGP